MTSRERLLSVLNHKIPDRVPVSTYDMTGWHFDSPNALSASSPLADYVEKNIFGSYLTGWWNQEPSYHALMETIRKKADCLYMTSIPNINGYVAKNTRIEQKKEGPSTFTKIILSTPKGDLTQVFRVDDGIYTAWQIEHKVKDESDIEKFLSIPFEPLPVDVSRVKNEDARLGDKGILLIDVPDPISIVFDLFDFGEFTVTAFTEQKTMTKLLDMVYEQQAYFMKEMLQKGAGPLFRFAGPEVCTPPYLPNELFKKFVVGYDKRLIRLIHDFGQYARIHSHGMVKTVINDFLEMEVDAIDPIEAPPSGDLELWEAKKLCGNAICLFGNIQLKDLEQLPPKQMREVVKRCVEQGKPGGNFVALPTATPLNAPLSPIAEENFHIFLDTVLEFGVYDSNSAND